MTDMSGKGRILAGLNREAVMAEKVFVRDIPDELWGRLKAGAARRGLTVSRAVAEALRLWLDQGESQKGGFKWAVISDLGSSGLTDVSENHDRHLADGICPGK